VARSALGPKASPASVKATISNLAAWLSLIVASWRHPNFETGKWYNQLFVDVK
jgi:hypothetical protein